MSQLDPVQIEALNFASGKKGVGFFLEQGLGKSLIALRSFHFCTEGLRRPDDRCDAQHLQARLA